LRPGAVVRVALVDAPLATMGVAGGSADAPTILALARNWIRNSKGPEGASTIAEWTPAGHREATAEERAYFDVARAAALTGAEAGHAVYAVGPL
jgi:hypothetical protein